MVNSEYCKRLGAFAERLWFPDPLSRNIDKRPGSSGPAVLEALPDDARGFEKIVFVVGQHGILGTGRVVSATQTTPAKKTGQRFLVKPDPQDGDPVENAHWVTQLNHETHVSW